MPNEDTQKNRKFMKFFRFSSATFAALANYLLSLVTADAQTRTRTRQPYPTTANRQDEPPMLIVHGDVEKIVTVRTGNSVS
jgi:hypothetical protein